MEPCSYEEGLSTRIRRTFSCIFICRQFFLLPNLSISSSTTNTISLPCHMFAMAFARRGKSSDCESTPLWRYSLTSKILPVHKYLGSSFCSAGVQVFHDGRILELKGLKPVVTTRTGSSPSVHLEERTSIRELATPRATKVLLVPAGPSSKRFL